MSDLQEDAFKIAKHMYDNKYIGSKMITVSALKEKLELPSDDFDASDTFLLEGKFLTGTMGGDSGYRALTADGIAFVRATMTERSEQSKPPDRVKRFTEWVKANKILSSFIILGVSIIAAAGFTNALQSLSNYFGSFSEEERAKKELANRGISLNEQSFLERIDKGDIEAVKLLIAARAVPDVNVPKDSKNRTPLLLVADKVNLDIVKILIQAGAKANWTLDAAVARGYPRAVKTLILSGGVNVDGEMNLGLTILNMASDFICTVDGDDYRTIVKILIMHGANPNISSPNLGNKTILMKASECNLEIVEKLLQAGADVNAVDDDGKTALMYATDSPQSGVEIIRGLIQAGANINARDKHGQTALRIIEQFPRREEEARLLRDNGATR